MDKPNAGIRTKARKAGVYLYEIADKLGVHETTLVRWMRPPLDHEKHTAINRAIDEIEQEKDGL